MHEGSIDQNLLAIAIEKSKKHKANTITMSTDPETKAINQETRVNRRIERLKNNPQLNINKAGYVDKDFTAKTVEIKERAKNNRDIANKKPRSCPAGQSWDSTLKACTP